MNQSQEITLLKSIIYYKDLEIIEAITEDIFSIPVLKLCFFVLKRYVQTYRKFPNKTEFSSYLQSLIEGGEVELPKDELQRKAEIQKLELLMDYATKTEDEVKDEVLNLKQLREEIQKQVVKNIFTRKIEDLKHVIRTGEKAETILHSLKTSIEKHSILTEDVKGIDWFLSYDNPVRKGVRETGYMFIDRNLDGGLGEGEIGLIASPPGRGKTTFLTNLAYNYLSMHHDVCVCYISLELNEPQIFARIISIYLQIPLSSFKEKSPKAIIKENLEKRLISEEEFMAFFRNIYVKYFPPGTDVMQITKFLKQFKKTKKPPSLVVLIDYLNEIDYPYIKEIWHKFDRISTELDNFAVENDVCMWIACQAHPKTRKLPKEVDESNLPKSKIIFDLKDLYGSKIGLSKKLTVGLGITQLQDSDFLYLSFFKNRITGKVNEVAQLRFNKQTYRLELVEMLQSSDYTDLLEISDIDSSKTKIQDSKNFTETKNVIMKEEFDFEL